MSRKLEVKNKYEKYNDVAMTQRMRWLNKSVVTINVKIQLLDIYRLWENKKVKVQSLVDSILLYSTFY